MSVKQRDNGSWNVIFRDTTGAQRWRNFGYGKDAEKEAHAFDLELKANRKRGKRPAPEPEKMHFRDLFDLYLKDREINGASKSYVDEIKSWFNNTLSKKEYLNKAVDDLQYDDILKLFKEYKDAGRKQSTIRRYGGYLRAVFHFGIHHGKTQKDPLLRWKKGTDQKKEITLTHEDVEKVMRNAAPHLRWGLEVLWNFGLRPGESELLKLKWEHVNWNDNSISVFATKTKKWRFIPIEEEFKNRLLEMKEKAKSEYIIEYRGKPLKKFRRSFRYACRKAGIPDSVVMYDMRHLWITKMLNEQGEPGSISEMAGHSSIKMTMDVYHHPITASKRHAISLLPKSPVIVDPPKPEKKAKKAANISANSDDFQAGGDRYGVLANKIEENHETVV